MCDKIAAAHNLEKCSAFQVRLGGIKGVLVRKIYSRAESESEFDEFRLKGDIVEIRPS